MNTQTAILSHSPILVASDGTYEAKLFDGKSSVANQIQIKVSALGALLVDKGEEGVRTYLRRFYKVESTPTEKMLRIQCNDGCQIELPFNKNAYTKLTMGQASRTKFVRVAETKSSLLFVLAIAAILSCFLLYRFGLPVAEFVLRPLVPHSIKELAGAETIKLLDKLVLKKSALSNAALEKIQKSVDDLSRGTNLKEPVHVEARLLRLDKEDIANAVAIIPNNIVVTDKIVADLKPEELEAVLAHELGHLTLDHGTQALVRGSVLTTASLLLFGADPGVLQGIAVSLTEAKHTQGQESEADLFALDLLMKLKKNPAHLVQALKKLDEEGLSEKASMIESYLSSHPMTSERIALINARIAKAVTK